MFARVMGIGYAGGGRAEAEHGGGGDERAVVVISKADKAGSNSSA